MYKTACRVRWFVRGIAILKGYGYTRKVVQRELGSIEYEAARMNHMRSTDHKVKHTSGADRNTGPRVG
jgi:hypothetical protein